MVRNYKPVAGSRRERSYTDKDVQNALGLINEGQPLKRVAAMFNIPRRTLRNHVSGERKTTVVGRKKALLPEEEKSIAEHVAVLGDFGYSFDTYELRVFVKSFLDKAGRQAPQFSNNMPGKDWASSFIKRHRLSNRVCQNISRKRASVSVEDVEKFFNNLSESLEGVPPENIVNYDETNLTDDPKSKTMLFRKGIKHPERVMNSSKSSVSLMFACSAAGDQLPPYVVYKAERMMDTWVKGGPMNARYNRTNSGWFDSHCFSDFLKNIAVPYFRKLNNDAPKILIGDNLASHMSATTECVCAEENIRFIFLPPNSTHLLQPLDVAVYGPMKKAWRKVLTEWKKGPGKYYTAMQKQWFPTLLFDLLNEMDNREQLVVAGFRATGIYPMDKERILRKITHEEVTSAHNLVSPLVLQHLRELRESASTNPNATRRGKRVQVEPGKSISLGELVAASTSSGTPVSRPAKRGASASGVLGRKRKVPRKRLPTDSPSSSDSDENVDEPLEVPVGGDEHEQETVGDSASETESEFPGFEEVTVSGHKVEEVPVFEKGDYVLVKFSGKKANYHFVGILRNLVEPEQTSWDVKYLRRDCEAGGTSFVFKEPANPDFMETPICDIVTKLAKPQVIKNKVCFTDTACFSGHIIR